MGSPVARVCAVEIPPGEGFEDGGGDGEGVAVGEGEGSVTSAGTGEDCGCTLIVLCVAGTGFRA